MFLLSLFFWLANINLMEMFSYLNRTFVMGDIYEFIQGLNISPLWILVPNLVFVGWGLYQFYRYEYIKMLRLLFIQTNLMKRLFLWLTFWPLPLTIIYWGQPVMWNLLSDIINIISLAVIILIIILNDPIKRHILPVLPSQNLKNF
jgi:hypothetical protein